MVDIEPMEAEAIPGCVFCERVANNDYLRTCGAVVVAFEPLNPVTPGHVLFVPRKHVRDATEWPQLAGETVAQAAHEARRMGEDCNIITSVGPAATQTVWHLHVHLVPRREGDGLHLPWTT